MKRSLRILALIVVLVVCGGITLRAQSDYSTSHATSYLTVGPSFSGGASLVLQPPDGLKVAPVFAFRGAADATYPLSPSIAAALGLGIEGRGFRLRSIDNTDIYTDTHLTYFSITPGFRFSAFFIGLGIGLPMSGSYTSKAGTGATESSRSFTTAEMDQVKLLVEPKLGAVVELMNDQTGWLGLTIMGTISSSEILDRPSTSSDAAGDFHLVSAQVGLTYQFSIPGTKRR